MSLSGLSSIGLSSSAEISAKPRIALINPPFGPGVLPNLGLSLLSAAVRDRGFSCRTFYWNLELVRHFSGNFQKQMRTFSRLTGRPWFPFNEWIFADQVYDSELRARADVTLLEMRRQTRSQPDAEEMRDEILRMKNASAELVCAIAEQLDAFDLIGISSTFLQNLPALALARAIKARWPKKVVVLGGANCDGEMGRALLEQFPFIDFTFTGEMDFAFADFVESFWRGQPTDQLPGINGRHTDGSLFSGPAARPVEAMDKLPTPDFDDYVRTWDETGHAAHHKLILSMESSRGCWWGERHHCTFCGLNANGMGYRRKTDDRFISEIESLMRRYRTRYLYLTDNILPMAFYDRFMSWAGKTDLELNYFYEIKSNVKRSHVEKLAAAGINSVQPGIESFSSKILHLMRKGITGIQNVAFLRLARECGILTSYSMLVGFPGEDPAEYAALVKEIPKLSHLQPPMALAEIEFHRFSPYHSAPEQFGLELKPSWHYEHLYPFEKETLAKIAYVFEPDGDPTEPRRYLKPFAEQLRRWGQGYRLRECTLIWSREGEDICVQDTRPGFGPMEYRLRRFAVDLFLFLDEPHSLKSILNFAAASASTEQVHAENEKEPETGELVVSFDASEFLTCPMAYLNKLEEAALLFTEESSSSNGANTTTLVTVLGAPNNVTGKQYVALPVPANYRQVQMGWLDLD